MSREQWDKWCERAILGLVMAILMFGPLAFGGVRPSEFLVLEALTVGVMLVWGLRLWLTPHAHLLWPPVCWFVLAFAGYAIVRYRFAELEYVARQELVRVLLYTALFLACVTNLYRRASLRWLTYGLILLGTLEACFAVYQFFTHAPRIWGLPRPQTYLDRAGGTYICPNHLAGFLEMILPLGLAYVVASRARPLTKVLLGYGCCAMAAGIVLTMSRGGWVAASFGLLVLLAVLAHTPRQWVALAVFVSILFGAGYLAYSHSVAMQSRLADMRKMIQRGVQNDTRFGLAAAAFRMWQDYPWFGVGPAHFDVRFRGYRAEHGLFQKRPGRAHNDYLNTLADWGAVGGILVARPFAVVGGGLLRHRRDLRRIQKDPARSSHSVIPFLAGAVAGLAAILLHSATDFNMHIPANAILAVVLLALVSTTLRVACDKYWVTLSLAVRVAASVLLVGGVIFFGLTGVRTAHEDFWLRRAASLPELSADKAAALQQAWALEPGNAETAYKLGEQFRRRSFQGEDDYAQQAHSGMEWFERAARVNPYDSLSRLGMAACLDWTDQHEAAEGWYEQARKLDPNGVELREQMGWHCYLLGDYAQAISWFKQAFKLDWNISPLSRYYWPLAEQKLAEQQRQSKPATP